MVDETMPPIAAGGDRPTDREIAFIGRFIDSMDD
jgi:hypothetical protein